jgi:uncharacterized protein YukJ
VPLDGYGVLKARPVDRRREGSADTPHYQVKAVADDGTAFRIAVNVRSQESPSDLLYLVDADFQHPITADLEPLALGWHDLVGQPTGTRLDFIRGNLFDPADMRPLPPDVGGPDNDLADLLEHFVERAMADADAALYAFGQRWGPEDQPDKIFGFTPGGGVHDIHMNQGNTPRFQGDDGVWQDGGLIVHTPAGARWVAVFLAFQSQAWHTDDSTGHALSAAPPQGATAAVRIVAALVNPVGPAPEQEAVVLLNASPAAVDLTGWQIADRQGRTSPAPATALAPGDTLRVALTAQTQLGNDGGAISLLDAAGLKVDGVAYTGAQAQDEGWTVVF